METFYTGSFFDVNIIAIPPIAPVTLFSARFTKISGLTTEFEYEYYNEGGNNYPRFFFKQTKTQTLVMEEGTAVEGTDAFALAAHLINTGVDVSFQIVIKLRDSTGKILRNWSVFGAHLLKYEGPQLDANQSEIAISRIEFVHNGAF